MGSTSTFAPGTDADVSGNSAVVPAVELFDDWATIEAAAGPELARSRHTSLFERLAWLRLVADHAPPKGRMLALRCGGSWLFLAAEGRSARAWANWYSLRFSATGSHAQNLVAIARALRQRAGIESVHFAPLAEADPLPAAFRQAGWLTFVTPATTSWTIDTRGMDFETYWASRGSRLRNTAKRKAKAAALDVEIYTHFDAPAWAQYEEVYRQSWKPAEGSPGFLRALAEQEGAAGTLRLGLARKDGRPLAAQLWLCEHDRATIHKLAYVEDARELSPGTILSVAMFRHALDVDKVELVDFGTGDDGYKAEWMDRSVPLNRLLAFNMWSVGGLFGAGREKACELVRRLRKL